MTFLGRSAFFVVAWLAFVARAAAVAPEIKDEAKYFSPEAVKKANETIREIYKKYGKDLLIETFASVPADQAEKVKDMTTAEKNTFFRKWAVQRAQQSVVQGIYILVCKDPRNLQILISKKTESVFDSKAFKKLKENLFTDFGNKKFDEGLLAAVKLVKDTLEKAKSE
jgi:uncharacterized membrane protein YgcG